MRESEKKNPAQIENGKTEIIMNTDPIQYVDLVEWNICFHKVYRFNVGRHIQPMSILLTHSLNLRNGNERAATAS